MMPDLNFVVTTMSSTAYYALLALAIIFVYRTNRVLLFCVGEIGAIAAFVVYSVYDYLDLEGYSAPWPISAAMGLVVAAGVGAVLLAIIEYLGRKVDHFVGTMVTIAVALVLQGIMSTVWQGEIYRFILPPSFVEVAGVRLSGVALGVAAVGLTASLMSVVMLKSSRIGYAMQALADDRALSALRGVVVRRLVIGVGALSGLLAGAGGLLGAAMTSISVENSVMSVSAVVAAIIGGLTNPLGAIVGALILSLVENLTTVYLDSRYSTLTPIVMLGIILAFRPYGLLGRQEVIQRV